MITKKKSATTSKKKGAKRLRRCRRKHPCHSLNGAYEGVCSNLGWLSEQLSSLLRHHRRKKPFRRVGVAHTPFAHDARSYKRGFPLAMDLLAQSLSTFAGWGETMWENQEWRLLRKIRFFHTYVKMRLYILDIGWGNRGLDGSLEKMNSTSEDL